MAVKHNSIVSARTGNISATIFTDLQNLLENDEALDATLKQVETNADAIQACKNACTSCTSSCGGNCTGGCSSECDSTCGGACAGCGDSCSNSCSWSCTDGCSGP